MEIAGHVIAVKICFEASGCSTVNIAIKNRPSPS